MNVTKHLVSVTQNYLKSHKGLTDQRIDDFRAFVRTWPEWCGHDTSSDPAAMAGVGSQKA